VSKVELNAVANVYLFMIQIAFETRLHKAFNEKFHKAFEDGSAHILTELKQVCVTNGPEEEWEKIKGKVDEKIKKRHSKLDTSPDLVYIETKATQQIKAAAAVIGTGTGISVGTPKSTVQNYRHAESVASLTESVLMRKVIQVIGEHAQRFTSRGFYLHLPITAKVMRIMLLKLEKGQDDGMKFS